MPLARHLHENRLSPRFHDRTAWLGSSTVSSSVRLVFRCGVAVVWTADSRGPHGGLPVGYAVCLTSIEPNPGLASHLLLPSPCASSCLLAPWSVHVSALKFDQSSKSSCSAQMYRQGSASALWSHEPLWWLTGAHLMPAIFDTSGCDHCGTANPETIKFSW
jgi:hypothetical protein